VPALPQIVVFCHRRTVCCEKIPEKRWRVADAEDVYHFENALKSISQHTAWVDMNGSVNSEDVYHFENALKSISQHTAWVDMNGSVNSVGTPDCRPFTSATDSPLSLLMPHTDEWKSEL
jgi:hypothetical protein